MNDAKLSEEMSRLLDKFRPSDHSFFGRLAACPTSALSQLALERFYESYQAAMHSTRVMLYFLPHLDTAELRMAKFKILADDDGLPDGDSHHAQLRRTWTFMLNRPPRMHDHEFGELESLIGRLDRGTAHFVKRVSELYRRSLGPLIVVEGLAHDWIGALMRGLLPHFPGVDGTDYFRESYASGVEVRHACEAIDLAAKVVDGRPGLYDETVAGAYEMAAELDRLWTSFDKLVFGDMAARK